ncbi:hypothetical protein N657DRAFT_604086 [Parathielavia appendiculata]|uniref:Uncharacterized protein n=1 Tax=Parathielavia appendiculata TaxID=2587402 RepID=A0AAN6YZB1_9PEZI|nr:hypothetical protein N657DRAFT_604086 [Parathielavia appendiculata]
MRAIALLSALFLPTEVLAAIGGQCSGVWGNAYCICLDRTECVNRYGGWAFEGRPGSYPCPHDPDNVWGCEIVNGCPEYDISTSCVWTTIAPGCRGRVLPDPACPGGNNFVCCDYD